MNERQSQNMLLKVDTLSTIRNNNLIAEGEKLEYNIATFNLPLRDTFFFSFFFLVFRRT